MFRLCRLLRSSALRGAGARCSRPAWRRRRAYLGEVLARRPKLRLHEFGFVGAIAETLRGFPNYSTSEFFVDVPPGEMGPNGVRCEDLTRLSFPESSFDVVISQDVMEHVSKPGHGICRSRARPAAGREPLLHDSPIQDPGAQRHPRGSGQQASSTFCRRNTTVIQYAPRVHWCSQISAWIWPK